MLGKTSHTLYVGIDWSGAGGAGGRGRCRGIQLALCTSGSCAPILLSPEPPARNWRRDEVLAWLAAQASQQRVLAGFDFSFTYPFCDAGSYFPGHKASPSSPFQLWAAVEKACARAPWLYGGPFVAQGAPYRAYLVTQGGAGSRYRLRYRVAERACLSRGVQPLCVFNCVGAQVGTGSVAGMRMLHAMATTYKTTFCIWPFNRLTRARSTVVEAFPSLLQGLAGHPRARTLAAGVMHSTLAFYGSAPPLQPPASEDQADAMIIAAALRYFDRLGEVRWASPAATPSVLRKEGWILGA